MCRCLCVVSDPVSGVRAEPSKLAGIASSHPHGGEKIVNFKMPMPAWFAGASLMALPAMARTAPQTLP